MKKLLVFFLTILMVASFSNKLMAQSNVDCPATANLINPISIVNDVAMNYATLASSATTGTVKMAATAGATLEPTGGATVISGTPTAGKFTVTGQGTQVFTITLPAVASELTCSAETITVDAWTCSETLTSATLVDGTLVFYVGGTLNIGAAQVGGEYTGTFNIIVDYN